VSITTATSRFLDKTKRHYLERVLLRACKGNDHPSRTGLSMDRAVIDLGPDIFAHDQAYVALSRVRSLAGVLLSNFCEVSLRKTSAKVLLEYARLRNML
jgi:hypothetical protein